MISVNKERARKVVDTINNLALASEKSRYTFSNFCESHKLFNENDKVLKSGNLFICCPFHHDESPSLGINEEKRVWNCLGCNKHGNFIDFVWNYTKEIEGRDITWYQQVNELLKADPELQKKVGASTIFQKQKMQEAFTGADYRRFRLQSIKPKTYTELATYMKRNKMPKNVIIFAMLQLQSGIQPELIYDSLFTMLPAESKPNFDTIVKKEYSYDLSELMGADTEGQA